MTSNKSSFDSIMRCDSGIRLEWMLVMSKSLQFLDHACFVDTFNKSGRIFTFFYSEWNGNYWIFKRSVSAPC